MTVGHYDRPVRLTRRVPYGRQQVRGLPTRPADRHLGFIGEAQRGNVRRVPGVAR